MLSEDWSMTPPSSPVLHNEKENLNLIDDSNENVQKDWKVRIFDCLGQADKNISYHPDGYFENGDCEIFQDDFSSFKFIDDDDNHILLFSRRFDKGTALIFQMNTLFKFARRNVMELSSAPHLSNRTYGIIENINKNIDYFKLRREVVEFLFYIRNYLQRVFSCHEYYWLLNKIYIQLVQELYKLRLSLGNISEIPDYTLNYAACPDGNKSKHGNYHMFHIQLDVRWMYITLLYQLSYFKKIISNTDSEFDNVVREALEKELLASISDLVYIGCKKFNQVQSCDISDKSIFSCTCVRELWRLLEISVDKMNKLDYTKCFWEYVQSSCDLVLEPKDVQNETNCSEIFLATFYKCTNPSGFVLLLIKNLAKLYSNVEDANNYSGFFGTVLKKLVKGEVGEEFLRNDLILVDQILEINDEMNIDVYICLWEYFHKRLNNTFLISNECLKNLAIVSKSALGLLEQVNNRLSNSKSIDHKNSYCLFLSILGKGLRKWNENTRFWNQLKGRIFSKFSSSKMSSMNESGLYHFISLFLTLAITSDFQEVCNKLQYLLKMVPIKELDNSKLELIWKGHIAVVILYAERNQDLSVVCNSLLDMVEMIAIQNNSISLMRIFIDGLQDIIDCTNNLQLGQYLFIGPWINHFLQHCGDSDKSRFLDIILSILNKIDNTWKNSLPLSTDNNQLWLLYESIREHVIPYVKKSCGHYAAPYQVADVASSFTLISLQTGFNPSIKNQVIQQVFHYFLTSDYVHIRILVRYLCHVFRFTSLRSSLNNQDIILIKGWLKCILVSDNDNEGLELSEINKYVKEEIPEIRKLLTNDGYEASANVFESFLRAVQYNVLLCDMNSKNKLRDLIDDYFSNIDKWLEKFVNIPRSCDTTLCIYKNVGLMFQRIPTMLYIKSKAKGLLQSLLDTLLLPVQVRKPQFKLHAYISSSIKHTLYYYIDGLVQLDPTHDAYISRSIRELISIYVPRLITPKGNILSATNSQFSLMLCFQNEQTFNNTCASVIVIQTIINVFIKRRSLAPHEHALQALIFLHDIIKQHKTNEPLITRIISDAFDRICDVAMYCDENNPCKKEAKEILRSLMDLHIIRFNTNIGDEVVVNILKKLCTEHLAFSARLFFDLLKIFLSIAPDMISRFLPHLLDEVRKVETKRGVGYDRSLRKGVESIEQALNEIRVQTHAQ